MPDAILPANVEEERRRDAGSRKIIERIERIQNHLNSQDVDLEEIRRDLKHHVTYKWLIGVAFGFAAAVGLVAWRMQETAINRVEENRVQREAAILQIRQEQAASNLRVETKVDGLIKYFIESKSKAEVRAELRAAERAAEPPAPLVPAPMKPGGGR